MPSFGSFVFSLLLAAAPPDGVDWPELRTAATADPGSAVEMRYVLVDRDGGERGAFARFPLQDVFVLEPAGRWNLEPIVPADADRGLLRLHLTETGEHRVCAETRPRVERVEASWLEAARADWRGPGSEQRPAIVEAVEVRRVHTMSISFTVGEDPRDLATRKTGLPIEMRVLANPRRLSASGDLAVRLYVDGEGIEAARVHARHESGATTEAWSDGNGIAKLKLARHGRWCLRFQHLRVGTTEEAEWDWLQATRGIEVRLQDTKQGAAAGTEGDR